MIVVLADDFSGAAELGGVALAHGLTAEVSRGREGPPPGGGVDVWAIDVGTRSLSSQEAEHRMGEAARQVAGAAVEWVYKKTDSVLRGHLRVETEAVAEALGLEEIVFLPANPSKGRRVIGGDYWIENERLHESMFALDPEFPALTSRVADHLRGGKRAWRVPDTATSEEVRAVAGGVKECQLVAGAAEFFGALLEARGHALVPVAGRGGPCRDPRRALWICGSLASWRRGGPSQAASEGFAVRTLPEAPQRLPAVLAIGESPMDGAGMDLLDALAERAAMVIRELAPTQIWVEGGATCQALFQRLSWRRFRLLGPSLEGVGVLAPLESAGMTLFVKPGSYAWPAKG